MILRPHQPWRGRGREEFPSFLINTQTASSRIARLSMTSPPRVPPPLRGRTIKPLGQDGCAWGAADWPRLHRTWAGLDGEGLFAQCAALDDCAMTPPSLLHKQENGGKVSSGVVHSGDGSSHRCHWEHGGRWGRRPGRPGPSSQTRACRSAGWPAGRTARADRDSAR